MGRKYTFKTQPRNFQLRAVKKAVKHERLGLFMPMRSGKTKTAIDWAGILHVKHGICRVLIITHTPKTFGVWRNEIRKHCPLPYITYERSIDKPPVDAQQSDHDLEFLIINIQSVYSRISTKTEDGRMVEPAKNEMLYDWEPEAIIVDESTTLGNANTVQSRYLYRLQRDCGVRFKLILSGTPMHRNLLNTFGQFKFLDDSLFGTAFNAFKRQYALYGGYDGFTLLKYINLKRYRQKIEPYVFQMRRVPHRPPINQVIPVDLSPKERKLYDQMESESIISFAGKTVTAPIILTRLLKQAQLAAGWVRDEDKEWHRVGTSLKDSFEVLLNDLHESEVTHVIVYCRHLPEIRDAREVARKVYGERNVHLLHGGTKNAEVPITRFHERGGVFIAQTATGSMGIDLSCADTTIWYTLTESLLHKDQADARMRLHADKRALTYYYLLPRDTIAESMYMALRSKMSLVEFVMKHPTLIHHEEVE